MENLPVGYTNLATLLFGLVIGSFTNVLIARLPKGESIAYPASRCPGCGHAIRWFENIPVLSFIGLRGKCSGCKAPISVRYPIVELMVGTLALAAKLKFGFGILLFIRDIPFVAMMVAITFIDLEHRIIPDPLSLGGLVLGLATAYWVPGLGLLSALIGAALGFGIFYGLALIYQLTTKRSGLGGGDIKLLAMLGAFLGPMGVLGTIFISSLTGSFVGIGWALATRRKNMMKVAIPYGPFLVVGGLYYYLLSDLLWFQFTTPT